MGRRLWACEELLWEPKDRSKAEGFRETMGVVWEWPPWEAQKLPAMCWGQVNEELEPHRGNCPVLEGHRHCLQGNVASPDTAARSPVAPKKTKGGDGVPGPNS